MVLHLPVLLAVLASSSIAAPNSVGSNNVGPSNTVTSVNFNEGIPMFDAKSSTTLELPPRQNTQTYQMTPVAETPKAQSFTAFTGKVTGKKVRLRLQPDLESYIVKELTKDDLVVVTGEKDQFWAIECPSDLRAFVFRSFVLDNTVEANRVNIRLQPELDAPILGYLNAGDHVDGTIANENPKWLEITPPASTRFYISKEYVEKIGGADYKVKFDKRKETATQLLEAAAVLAKVEFKKSFPEVDIERIAHSLKTLAEDYQDMPALRDRAKDALTALHEEYLNKKIAYLEAQVAGPEEAFVANETPVQEVVTDRMQFWLPIEEALYLSSRECSENKDMNEYYDEQKMNAVAISGVLEPFQSSVKHRPGDFILKSDDQMVGYLYSASVNLQNFLGKRVTVYATSRPNNHFAYPAWYVHSVEKE